MFYPVNLNIVGKVCLVVGGGTVALRKVRGLLACGAQIRVVSPAVVADLDELARQGRLIWEKRGYTAGDLDGVFLVFAATDQPTVQRMIAQEAKERGVMLNSADDPAACDFQVPAQVRRGDLLLTISTSGASPALSRRIRQQLQREFGPEYGMVVELFARIRDMVVTDVKNSEEHKELFRSLLHQGLVESVQQGDWATVRAIVQGTIGSQFEADRVIQEIMPQPAEKRDE